MLKCSFFPNDAVFIFTRMFKGWNRVFPESWRNTWRRSVGASFLTINLNGVQYPDTHLHVPTNSHSFPVHLYHAIVLHRHDNKGCCSVFLFFSESESDGLKNTKLSHLSALLDKEKKRAESLKETCRENTVLLQRQTQLYLCVRALSINM